MTEYNAGKSVATWELRTDKGDRAIADLTRRLEAFEKLQKRVFAPQTATPLAAVTAPINALNTAQARAAITAGRLATEQRRAALEAQRLTTEENKTAREVANTAAAQDRAATAALRRRQAEERAARQGQNGGLGPALPRTFAGFTAGGLGQLAGLAGVNIGVQALVDAGGQALKLRETQNGLRAIAGSTENYTRVLKTAREQQELFGGTLEENIQGLTGLTITSRQSGAELSALIDLSQRLAVLDPAQGAAGARIALSEALSGDPTSLAKRYEIPRAALAKLRDESTSAGEKLLIIDQYLNRVGITSEAVAGRIDQDALAFRRAKAEIEEATIKLGDYLARIAAVPARGVTELLDTGAVTGGAAEAGASVQAKLVRDAQSYDAYTASIAQANNRINESFKGDPLGAALARQKFGLETLNPVQLAYAQSLIQTGIAADQAVAQSLALGDTTDLLARQLDFANQQGGAVALTFGQLTPQMAAMAAVSADNAQRVLDMNGAFLAGDINARQLQAGLEALAQVQEIQRQASFQEEREMRALERSFVDVVPTANAAAAAIAGISSAAGIVPENRHIGGIGNTAPGGILGGGAGATFARVDAQQRALQDSRDQLALANAKTNAEKIAIYQRQLDRQTTEEGRNRILAQIASLKNAGGGGSSLRGLTALDQDAIQAGETTQAQLAEVNRLLERGNLTAHQRNDLLEKRRKLEEQITTETRKQADAALDAQLGAVRDAQARLKETREAAGLQRALAGGRLSETQQQAVGLRLSEIALEQEKRRREIQKDAATGGLLPAVTTPTAAAPIPVAVTQPLPLPNVAALTALPQVVVNLTLNVDKSGNVTPVSTDPNVILNLLSKTTDFRNLSGGV